MRSRKQSGYSLIEVLVAVAVTGFVLLTVVTLFYMGRRNVYSGKQQTLTVSVATRMLEDLSLMANTDLMSAFNITNSTTLGNVTVGSTTYTNSYMLDTTSAGGASDPGGYLTAWKSLLDPTKITNPKAGLIFTPRLPTNANQPWTSAQVIKVRAWVQWDEGKRTRYSFYDTSKYGF